MVFLRPLFAIAALLLLAACGADPEEIDTEETDTWEFYEESQDDDSEVETAPVVDACTSSTQNGTTQISFGGPVDDGKCIRVYLTTEEPGSTSYMDAPNLEVYPEPWELIWSTIVTNESEESPIIPHAINDLTGEIDVESDSSLSLSFDLTVDYQDESSSTTFDWAANNIDASTPCPEHTERTCRTAPNTQSQRR